MNPTDEQVIRERQEQCSHVFARGVSDSAAQCVHCGLPEAATVLSFAGYSP